MKLKWLVSVSHLLMLSTLWISGPVSADTGQDKPPNIIIILTDDMGYGDIGAYGSTRIRTPHIDAIAQRGILLTNAYASANVCSPSRAGLLTGRYAIRSGLAWKVVEAGDSRGLPGNEETIAELVKRAGYRTGMIGKWHLGSFPEYLPLKHGFDYFFGVPHSNDMPHFALYEGASEIESPVDQRTLTRRYTEAATAYIEQRSAQPFLLYLAHTSPHIPLYASQAFSGKSAAGVYGDVIEEIDWSTGEILAALKRNHLLDNTLIIFTSDNGPFFEGSTSGLKGGKGNSWEGGYRVPFVASWPAAMQGGVTVDSIAMNIDVLPTIADILGLPAQADTIDGASLLPLFKGSGKQPDRYLYFFNNEAVVGLRDQDWKYLTHAYYTGSIGAFEKFDQLPGFESPYDLLFDARGVDGESYSVADRHPDALARMKDALAKARKEFGELRTRPPEKTYPR
jgi:arylsulfatase A